MEILNVLYSILILLIVVFISCCLVIVAWYMFNGFYNFIIDWYRIINLKEGDVYVHKYKKATAVKIIKITKGTYNSNRYITYCSECDKVEHIVPAEEFILLYEKCIY